MMTIIAERINMTRKSIREKAWARDAEFIRNEVRQQEARGATHIDVNAGADPAKELEDMRWLAEIVSGATELPLSSRPAVSCTTISDGSMTPPMLVAARCVTPSPTSRWSRMVMGMRAPV